MPAEPARARPLGVILTAGSGTRLRPLTPATPKALVPLLNRPLLAYAFDLCAGMGLDEVIVVVDDADGAVAAAAPRLAAEGMAVGIAVQAQPRGPADAVTTVGARLDGRVVVVVAVDTVIRHDHLRTVLDEFVRSPALAALPLHPTSRPREMGIAELDGARIVRLEEKPERPRSHLAVVGIWMLVPAAVARLRERPAINARGEADLTGTVAALVAEGAEVLGRRIDGEWLDAGALDSLLDAQARLLADLPPVASTAGAEIQRSVVDGAVRAGAGARVRDSRLAGPVLIGAGALVEHCELGPGVVVGEGAELRGVRLRRVLVAPGARLADVAVEDAVVGVEGTIGAVEPARRG